MATAPRGNPAVKVCHLHPLGCPRAGTARATPVAPPLPTIPEREGPRILSGDTLAMGLRLAAERVRKR